MQELVWATKDCKQIHKVFMTKQIQIFQNTLKANPKTAQNFVEKISWKYEYFVFWKTWLEKIEELV